MEVDPEETKGQVVEMEEECLPFMSLPSEIRGMIYNKIPQNELLQLRLASRAWSQDVLELYEFSVEFDDRNLEKWRALCRLQLRITSIKVIHFMEPENPENSFLAYPTLITSLEVSTPNILPVNLFNLLSVCCENLKKLSVNLSKLSIEPVSLERLQLDKLKELTVIVSAFPQSPYGYNEMENQFQEPRIEELFAGLLRNARSGLKVLKLDLNLNSVNQVSSLIGQVLQCISNHWNSLHTLDFQLNHVFEGFPVTEFQPLNNCDVEGIDAKSLNKAQYLKHLRIQSTSPIGINFWIDVMENQRKLETLAVDIFPVNHSIFSNVILNSSETLVTVEIGSLTVWRRDTEEGNSELYPFDATVFKECSALKNLSLMRNVGNSIREYDAPELTNVDLLPPSLWRITLKYFNVSSLDLLMFCDTETRFLEKVALSQCGNKEGLGVTGTVLQRLLSIPSNPSIEITTFSWSDPSEAEALRQVLVSSGFKDTDSYVRYI